MGGASAAGCGVFSIVGVLVAVVIAVGSSTFDCAAAEGGCAVLAHLPDSGEGPIAVLLFAPDLPKVDAATPPMR